MTSDESCDLIRDLNRYSIRKIDFINWKINKKQIPPVDFRIFLVVDWSDQLIFIWKLMKLEKKYKENVIFDHFRLGPEVENGTKSSTLKSWPGKKNWEKIGKIKRILSEISELSEISDFAYRLFLFRRSSLRFAFRLLKIKLSAHLWYNKLSIKNPK